MKKKSFLGGVNAKLALATVALTSVMFTSCEKEEFNVAPVELDSQVLRWQLLYMIWLMALS